MLCLQEPYVSCPANAKEQDQRLNSLMMDEYPADQILCQSADLCHANFMVLPCSLDSIQEGLPFHGLSHATLPIGSASGAR